MIKQDLAIRFWAKVEKTSSCWFWKGSLTRGGYGQIRVNGKLVYVHRLACAISGRPIPEGETADHLCRQRNCVNPDHIESVTFRENILRGIGPTAINARRTTCKKGHELLHLFNEHRRDCIECTRKRTREAQRRYRERLKAK